MKARSPQPSPTRTWERGPCRAAPHFGLWRISMIRIVLLALGAISIFTCTIAIAQTRTKPPEERREESTKLSGQSAPPDGKLTLWYRQPATNWNEALPVGSGRHGAMVYGGAASDRIQLNEHSIWERYP